MRKVDLRTRWRLFGEAVAAKCRERNLELEEPLGEREARAAAKSIVRETARCLRGRFESPEEFLKAACSVVAMLCRPNIATRGGRVRGSEIVTTVLFSPSDSMDSCLGVRDLHGIRRLYRLYVDRTADKGEPNGKD